MGRISSERPISVRSSQYPIVVQTYVGTPVAVLRGEHESTLRYGAEVLNTKRPKPAGELSQYRQRDSGFVEEGDLIPPPPNRIDSTRTNGWTPGRTA